MFFMSHCVLPSLTDNKFLTKGYGHVDRRKQQGMDMLTGENNRRGLY